MDENTKGMEKLTIEEDENGYLIVSDPQWSDWEKVATTAVATNEADEQDMEPTPLANDAVASVPTEDSKSDGKPEETMMNLDWPNYFDQIFDPLTLVGPAEIDLSTIKGPECVFRLWKSCPDHPGFQTIRDMLHEYDCKELVKLHSIKKMNESHRRVFFKVADEIRAQRRAQEEYSRAHRLVFNVADEIHAAQKRAQEEYARVATTLPTKEENERKSGKARKSLEERLQELRQRNLQMRREQRSLRRMIQRAQKSSSHPLANPCRPDRRNVSTFRGPHTLSTSNVHDHGTEFIRMDGAEDTPWWCDPDNSFFK